MLARTLLLLTPVLNAAAQFLGGDPAISGLSTWIDEHNRPNDVLVINSTIGNQFAFNAAAKIFLVEGIIDLTTLRLTSGNLTANCPIWGEVPLVNSISGDLRTGITIPINLGKNLTDGSVTLHSNTSQFFFDYKLNISWAGVLSDSLDLFPIPLAAQTIIGPGTPTWAVFSDEDELNLLGKFLDDHLNSSSQEILISSYIPPNGIDLAASKAYTFTVTFLSILELEGSIDPSQLLISAALYVRVPIWGRVRLTGISGSLIQGIKVDINVLVASGNVILFLQGKDVFIEVNLQIKFFGSINDKTKLFTLPFVFLFIYLDMHY